MAPIKYLKTDEVSTEVRSLLDFNSQCLFKNGLRINGTCINCRRKQSYRVANVRRGGQGVRCHSCAMKSRTGTGIGCATWKGGRRIDHYGYVLVRAPNHPRAHKGYVFEHRLVMEKMVGRYLKRHETVHHKNGNRQDNRPENLELWTGSHGRGIRLSDKPHCRTCHCARKIKGIPIITLETFISTA